MSATLTPRSVSADELLRPLSYFCDRFAHAHGERAAPGTLARWIRRGVSVPGGGRVRLQAVRVGSRWKLTETAFAEFLKYLTSVHTGNGEQGDQQFPRSATERERAAAAAGRELAAAGV